MSDEQARLNDWNATLSLFEGVDRIGQRCARARCDLGVSCGGLCSAHRRELAELLAAVREKFLAGECWLSAQGNVRVMDRAARS